METGRGRSEARGESHRVVSFPPKRGTEKDGEAGGQRGEAALYAVFLERHNGRPDRVLPAARVNQPGYREGAAGARGTEKRSYVFRRKNQSTAKNDRSDFHRSGAPARKHESPER